VTTANLSRVLLLGEVEHHLHVIEALGNNVMKYPWRLLDTNTVRYQRRYVQGLTVD
jgi:hypothetical protein